MPADGRQPSIVYPRVRADAWCQEGEMKGNVRWNDESKVPVKTVVREMAFIRLVSDELKHLNVR